jgi:hypothetical protein
VWGMWQLIGGKKEEKKEKIRRKKKKEKGKFLPDVLLNMRHLVKKNLENTNVINSNQLFFL